MNPSFLMLLAAAGILRYLAVQAKRTFHQRLGRLLPRNVTSQHVAVLIEQFPQQIPQFRWRVLPFSALHIFLNATSCAAFVVALWWFPPSAMSDWDLFFMRYGSLLIVPAAFLFDVWSFARLFLLTLIRRDEFDGQA